MYEYPTVRRVRVRRNPRPARPESERRSTTPGKLPTFVTMLEPSVRAKLDIATRDTFKTVHTESVADALKAAQAHGARGFLLSPTFLRDEPIESLDRLIGSTLTMLTVAIVSEPPAASAKTLLGLGACGVRRAIDLGRKDAWDALRNLVDHVGSDTGVRILEEIGPLIETATRETQQFFRTLIGGAPNWGSMSALAQTVRVGPSTLNSKFYRAGLPSPKRFLAVTRLLYAAAFLEAPTVSIAQVANTLAYSSPQSFNRHVQAMLGLSAGQFRREHSFASALEDYKRTLLMPHQSIFRSFRPIRQDYRPSVSLLSHSIATANRSDRRAEKQRIAL